MEELKQAIREAGLRATPARIATLEILYRAGAPLTHADVAEKLASRGIDKATAFRNLNDLAEAGLLRKTELGTAFGDSNRLGRANKRTMRILTLSAWIAAAYSA